MPTVLAPPTAPAEPDPERGPRNREEKRSRWREWGFPAFYILLAIGFIVCFGAIVIHRYEKGEARSSAFVQRQIDYEQKRATFKETFSIGSAVVTKNGVTGIIVGHPTSDKSLGSGVFLAILTDAGHQIVIPAELVTITKKK